MKVALVIEHMDVARGGRETSTAQIAQHLAQRGCDVSILCQQAAGPVAGAAVKPLNCGGRSRLARLRSFAAAVEHELTRGGYDIGHGTLPLPGLNVYQPRGGTLPGQRAASLRRRSIPARGPSAAGWLLNPVRRQLARWERRLVGDGTWCLAVSSMVGDELRRLGCRDRLRVVLNGVDIPPMSPERVASCRASKRSLLGIDDEAPLLVTIATNWSLKAVDNVIRAFARTASNPAFSQARLVCIGRDEPARYALLADRLGLTGRVDFPGRIPDVHEWLAAATVNVLLTWYDPCSRVVLEALRWGVPSITTAFNGAADALDEQTGVVVPTPRDVDAVAEAMATLADPDERPRRREACLAASHRVSMQRHVDELLAVYAEAASSG